MHQVVIDPYFNYFDEITITEYIFVPTRSTSIYIYVLPYVDYCISQNNCITIIISIEYVPRKIFNHIENFLYIIKACNQLAVPP